MTILLLVAFLALFALIGYGLANAWRHALHDTGPLPLYAMLRRQGLTAGEASDELGVEAIAFAARRCALCGYGAACRQRVAAGRPAPAGCPNSELFAGITRPRA